MKDQEDDNASEDFSEALDNLGKVLEAKAAKFNLTRTNVKNILRVIFFYKL